MANPLHEKPAWNCLPEIRRDLDLVNSTLKNSGSGDGPWTHAILTALARIGAQSGFSVSAARADGAHAHEWLYDMVWYRLTPSDAMRQLGLVVESEWAWNKNARWWDFDKLLVARAQARLFIYQGADRDDVYRIAAEARERIAAFEGSIATDVWWFAGYDYKGRQFEWP